MGGIERLRKLSYTVCKVIGDMELYKGSDPLWSILADIAGQIEREHVSRMRVLAVVTEMERHVSGVEGAEDSPVARWARELREALGGKGNDPTNDVSMSAYDLLPADEREAVAWVREHGGLGAVKDEWNNLRTVKQQLEKAQSKVERQQWHIESIQSKIAERRDRIADLECERDELRTQVDAMRPRLMPEGMEWLVEAWPRFEDDAPVRFLDDFERYGEENGVSAVTMYSDGSFALNFRAYSKGERVKRPAPKVLDADGAEIRVGDTVWHTRTRDEYSVIGVPSKSVINVSKQLEGREIHGVVSPYSLTHRAPVLAADGRPLREGETVYLTGSPTAFVVDDIMTREDGATVVHLADGAWHLPQDLTHERPDSYDTLWEDIENCAVGYADFLCRVKAIAERDA